MIPADSNCKLLFVYCNLKKQKPLHSELKTLGALYIGTVSTEDSFALVSRNGEAYLMEPPPECTVCTPVQGELYHIKNPEALNNYFKVPKESELIEIKVTSTEIGSAMAYTFICNRKDLVAMFQSNKLTHKDSF